jgi:hypothetical protein
MTESQAYRMLGWPAGGGEPHSENRFVLPLSGSESEDWFVTRCYDCRWSGVSLGHILPEGCPSCGKAWSHVIG